MNVLGICAGLGGLELGLRAAEPIARTVCFIEKDEFWRWFSQPGGKGIVAVSDRPKARPSETLMKALAVLSMIGPDFLEELDKPKAPRQPSPRPTGSVEWQVRYHWLGPGQQGDGCCIVTAADEATAIRKACKRLRGVPLRHLTLTRDGL